MGRDDHVVEVWAAQQRLEEGVGVRQAGCPDDATVRDIAVPQFIATPSWPQPSIRNSVLGLTCKGHPAGTSPGDLCTGNKPVQHLLPCMAILDSQLHTPLTLVHARRCQVL